MPRRRLQGLQPSPSLDTAAAVLGYFTGLTPMAAKGALQVATHAHKQKGHSPDLTRSHLVNFKQQGHRRAKSYPTSKVRNFRQITQRRTKTYGNKISRTSTMPYRRRSTYKRKSRPRRRRLQAKVPLGFPRRKLVRFRLNGYNTLTAGVGGAIQTAMVKANSLNDPMGAVGAQLPHTLDQWAAFYEKYTILGSKLTVKFGLLSNTGPVNVGIHLHKNSTALTSYTHYREVGLTKFKTLSTQRDQGTLQMKYSGKRFWHVASLTSDSEQEASFTTTPGDPTDIAYFHVFAQDVAGAEACSVDYQFELEFLCLLNEPINVARSSL